jgi:hypothetical protein
LSAIASLIFSQLTMLVHVCADWWCHKSSSNDQGRFGFSKGFFWRCSGESEASRRQISNYPWPSWYHTIAICIINTYFLIFSKILQLHNNLFFLLLFSKVQSGGDDQETLSFCPLLLLLVRCFLLSTGSQNNKCYLLLQNLQNDDALPKQFCFCNMLLGWMKFCMHPCGAITPEVYHFVLYGICYSKYMARCTTVQMNSHTRI